jgi:hypothetical protein
MNGTAREHFLKKIIQKEANPPQPRKITKKRQSIEYRPSIMEVLSQEKPFYEGSGFRSPRLDYESSSPFGITEYHQATRTLDSARSD